MKRLSEARDLDLHILYQRSLQVNSGGWRAMYNAVHQRADRVYSRVGLNIVMGGSHRSRGAGHRTWVDDVAETSEEKMG